MAYRLTGTQEEKIKGLVGARLEIQGRLKRAADTSASATQPGDKLPPEVEIVSFRQVSSPEAVSEPAPTMSTTPTTPTTPTRAQATTPPPTQPTTPVSPEPRTPRTNEPRELPRTASASGLVVLIGVLALMSGFLVRAYRRRAL